MRWSTPARLVPAPARAAAGVLCSPPARTRPTTGAPRLRQVLEQLPEAQGVLVTAGALGSAYCFRGSGGKLDLSGRVPVLRVQVQDTTGAGDAFLAGFLFSMVQARPPLAAQASG